MTRRFHLILICIIILLRMSLVDNLNRYFHLYETFDMRGNQTVQHYDCFYASGRPTMPNLELLLRPYCIRPSDDSLEKLTMINESEIFGTRFTFFQLRQLSITVENLYEWSASLNTIEQYQLYLIDSSVTNGVFYNCSSTLWFGPFCQYTLNSLNSFNEVVNKRFQSRKIITERNKNPNILQITSGTCYIRLKCNRGPPPMCLDWREICDRKCDCIDDCIDEKDCSKLEINECDQNQYRCRNGMCIPQDLFRDSNDLIDCMDGTDETFFTLSTSSTLCLGNPIFDCETLVCSGFDHFACGNGECFRHAPVLKDIECANERDRLHINTLFAYNNASELPKTCWQAIVCGYGFDDLYDVKCNRSLSFKLECPPVFFFPSLPTLFNKIRFVYEPQKTGTISPSFICYDAEWCDESLRGTFFINGTACKYLHEFPFFVVGVPGISNHHYYNAIELIFRQRCSPSELTMSNGYECFNPTLFHCNSTSKCISKYRVLDKTIDCYDSSDELFNDSCSLNLSHRFYCSSDKKCIPNLQLGDNYDDCSGKEDEMDVNIDCIIKKKCDDKKIIFSKICNGFTEMTPIQIDEQNETDETNCQDWPCDTQYTHCDKVWNCANGIDELNCSYVTYPYECEINEHHCIPIANFSHHSISFGCLPVNLAGNNKTDCLGSADERSYCRLNYPNESNRRYRCLNDTTCIDINRLCNCEFDCPSHDDEFLCPWLLTGLATCSLPEIFYCERNSNVHRSFLCEPKNIECNSKETALVCDLNEFNKPERKYFSVGKNFLQYPNNLTQAHLQSLSVSTSIVKQEIPNENSLFFHWYCNEGVLVNSFDGTFYCFCSPAYYGDRCQYQNEFIGLILYIRRKSVSDHLSVFRMIITLLDDKMRLINQEEILYVSLCEKRYQIYLPYRNRSKLRNENYSVRLDLYSIHRLNQRIQFRTSFFYKIPFTFLPVNRLVVNLNIPSKSAQTKDCEKFPCQNGKCYQYENDNELYCRCNTGWFGQICDFRHQCNCAPQSLCFERSCICPLGKSGSLCYVPDELPCKTIVCQHGGTCIATDQRISGDDSQCLCTEEFEGKVCEKRRMRFVIHFDRVSIPTSALIHYFMSRISRDPDYLPSFKRISLHENEIILYPPKSYNMVFVQFDNNYYLIFLNSSGAQQDVSTFVIDSNKCLHIESLLDRTRFQYHPLKRIKYYQLICRNNQHLRCFYDEAQLCLCTKNHLADCFHFDHNGTSSCDDENFCENDGKCYVNDLKCPTKFLCVCQECFHGTLCQFTTSGSVLSLDSIIGDHIKPYITFLKQNLVIQFSTLITMIMFTIGFFGNILAMMTFSQKEILDIGCGIYLLTSSIVSILTMISFAYKFWILIVTQMALIQNEIFLNINCKIADFLLRFLPTTVEWLNACVATERVLNVLLGTHFSKVKSRFWAKYTITIVILINIISAIHDPLNRRLIKDIEEERIWCVASYSKSSWLSIYNTTVNIIHFIVPFGINFISACTILIMTTRQRAVLRKNQTFRENLKEQFQRQKHLFISSLGLVILSFPRLIISFFSGCMRSARNPWLFLAAYFISFIPPVLTFFIFVPPSESYKTQFYLSIKYYRTKLMCIRG